MTSSKGNNPRQGLPGSSTAMWAAGIVPAVLLALFSSVGFAADAAAGPADAFRNGKFNIAFRYRFELVDQDGIGNNANASTLRTRLTYKTAPFRDWALLVEADDVRPVFGRDFNDTRNGRTNYPVVADPQGTDLNRAALIYTGLDRTKITIGRQRIIRANHRMIGNVGWRQNEQTYDGLSINYAFSDQFKLFYSYVDRVRRIFGPDSGTPAAELDSSIHLFDLSYDFGRSAKLFGYSYWIDFDNAPALSNQTTGIRLTGSRDISSGLALSYTAEFARQQDFADNAASYDANYYLLQAGVSKSGYSIQLGYEVLEGSTNPGERFQTPLATLHAMNGWADKFLSTPDGGIEDLSVAVGAKLLKGTMKLIYHDFSAETGSADYGSEVDFVAKWKFSKAYSVLAKLALYDSDQLSVDTNKFWLMLSANF